jgi:nucleoside phosphorylase/predicted MPP superfamily phosphohydrolase
LKDFFISYNQADREWAEWIAWQLEDAGYTTVLQAWDFRPGSNFALEMHSAAQAAGRTIAVLSPDYLSSQYTLPEWAAAFAKDPTSKQGKLLPVRVKECDPEGLLRQLVYLDLIGLKGIEAKRALLSGVALGRHKPISEPLFPGLEPTKPEHVIDVRKSAKSIRLLHLSDLWFGFTRDSGLYHQLLSSLSQDILQPSNGFEQTTDALLITGDISFSAKSEEFQIASTALTGLFKSLNIDPATNCFLTPGDHDVDWSSIGPADGHIIENLATEEDIAKVLAHPPTMELLSARLGRFCDFTRRVLGKARGWRRDRPWRVDLHSLAGRRVAFIQLNSAWTLGPKNEVPIVGEYQARAALTESADSDIRIWLLHHPISTLRHSETHRFAKMLANQDGVDLVFSGSRHSDGIGECVTQRQGYYELSTGPMYPGLVDPTCLLIEIDPNENAAAIQVYSFDRQRQCWARSAFVSPGKASQNFDSFKMPLASIEHISLKPPTGATGVKDSFDKPGHRPVQRKQGKKPLAIRSVSVSEFPSAVGEHPLLIVTVVESELRAVLDFLKPLRGKSKIWRGHGGQETYYAGRYGAQIAIVTMCGVGSIGRDSVILSTQQAITEWRPRAVIMVGIAFGKDREKQKLGDVLVASQVVSYEQQRIGDRQVIYRGAISQTGPVLLNRFRQALDWRYMSDQGDEINFHVGPLLSGEKLIDQAKYKEELFGAFPQAIGGEMEGAGLCAVAARTNTEWLIVKGICDWADGTKSDDAQSLAAHAAASLVHHVLSDPAMLDAL